MIKRIAAAERLLNEGERIFYNKPMPEISEKDRNALIESAANSVKVEYSEALGRCVVATRDLEPGEIIAVEKAFCSLLECKYGPTTVCLTFTIIFFRSKSHALPPLFKTLLFVDSMPKLHAGFIL